MLVINEARKEYPGFSLLSSLQVNPGQVTGLIGQNGAGKTTLFKLVLQLIRADGGQISLFGKDLAQLTSADRQKLGVVLSDAGFSGYLTVTDVRKILKATYPAFDEALFIRKCQEFRLDEKKKINDFSSGMKVKLKILVALTHQAQLLILDEPTAGLDVLARDEILTMLREYMAEDENRSILISSHISTDLESLCDDLYLIHDGHILMHEDTDQLLGSYAVLKMTEQEYDALDKRYILKRLKEPYGYRCLARERQFYQENNPSLVVEKSGIDECILLMVKGESI